VKVKPYEQTSTVDVRPVCCECFHSFTYYLILCIGVTAALPSLTWWIWLAQTWWIWPAQKVSRRPRPRASGLEVCFTCLFFSILMMRWRLISWCI